VFSLGKLLYFLITEKSPPMGASEPGQVLPYLREVGDQRLESSIHRSISYQPEERFQSVSDMMKSIAEA
jgi:hypothetical protein